MSATSCLHSYGHPQDYMSDPRLGLLLSQVAGAPEMTQSPLGQRKRPCRTQTEIQEGLRDLQRLKRLRIGETGVVVDEGEEETPCQALILRPVAPDELVFRMAVGMDFASSSLGQLLLGRDATGVQGKRPCSRPPIEESDLGEEEGRRSDASGAADDAQNKQLALYQAPSVALAELFKEASYLDEHQMALD